jgi:hypothetical protein
METKGVLKYKERKSGEEQGGRTGSHVEMDNGKNKRKGSKENPESASPAISSAGQNRMKVIFMPISFCTWWKNTKICVCYSARNYVNY